MTADSLKWYPVGLVGEQYCTDAIKTVKPGDQLWLRLEPDNPHDPFAIEVITRAGHRIGYIARDNFVQDVIHDQGRAVVAMAIDIDPSTLKRLDVRMAVVVVERDEPESSLLEPGQMPPALPPRANRTEPPLSPADPKSLGPAGWACAIMVTAALAIYILCN